MRNLFASKSEPAPLPTQLTSPLESRDQEICISALQEAMEMMSGWQAAPDTFWEDQKTQSVRGLGSIILRSKSMGSDPRLYLGIGDWPDVSLSELRRLTQAAPGAAKERFDPSIKRFLQLHSFQAPWDQEIAVVKTMTHPALMGMISARECDDILTSKALPDGCVMEFGVGLQCPLFLRHMAASKRLQDLSNSPTAEPGLVKCIDYTSGFYFQPLDADSIVGGRGKIRLWYFLQSDAGGSVPRWAQEKALPGAIVGFFAGAFQELQLMRSE